MYSLHSNIINAIKNKKLVFFVGAGFSQVFGFPDWKQLVVQIINELSVDYPKYQSLINLLNDGVMSEVEVLEKLKEHKGVILDNIHKTFNANILDNEKLKLHKKVWQITNKIITTNYDKAFESASSEVIKILPEYHYQIGNINNVESYLFKLHGCAENPATCILFQDDYCRLYEDENSAIFELMKIISDKTIVFLGYSLSDPNITYLLSYIKKLYNDLKPKHFIITNNNIDFSEYGLESINIESWNNLDSFLNSMIKIKQVETIKEVSVSLSDGITNIPKYVEPIVKIALLIAAPIGSKIDISFRELIDGFKNYQLAIDCFYLTIDNLRNLDEYDYIFIFTQSQKNKVVIENEYLMSKLISLEYLIDNLNCKSLKSILICLENKMDNPAEIGNLISPPIVLVNNFKKKDIKDLLFKLFRKPDIEYLKVQFVCLNIDMLEIVPVSKGECTSNISKPKVSEFIDPKNLIEFVGRESDIESITRKIIDLKANSKILNVKGAGGIGKTTTIKKVSYELALRNYFKEGIYFIECEHIEDYTTFLYKISQCFDISNITDIKDHIRINNLDKDIIIILDNFETLLYIKESGEVKNLIKFISDYATIIITSREVIFNTSFEDIYQLRNFTTDEALELFTNRYKLVNKNDIRKLRSEVLEGLLNNNPLAIKIVTKNLPKHKDIDSLIQELKEDFFETTNEYLDDIYNKEIDNNIEKEKSLYQSINYSYKRLSDREKLAFEILSIFPDGIDIENFKVFFKKQIYKPITDKELISLENKSLIEIQNSYVKLQSIIRRFAEYHFNIRTDEEKSSYYREAYNYNVFLFNSIVGLYHNKTSIALEIFDNFSANFSKTINYIDKFESEKVQKLAFLLDLSNFYHSEFVNEEYTNNLDRKKSYFSDVKNGVLAIDIAILYYNYYNKEFSKTYNKLNEILQFDDIMHLDYNYNIDFRTMKRAIDIYFLEGKAIECLTIINENNLFKISNLGVMLFELGEYSKFLELVRFQDGFFYYELCFNTNKLDVEELNKYLGKVYKKQYLELVQAQYIKGKAGVLNLEDVKKLVVTNPYTKGLKKLMLAFLETNENRANDLYLQALSDLEHIKYYYIEAIYYYAKFLSIHNKSLFKEWVEKGYCLASMHSYRFLMHKFECLSTEEMDYYDEKNYNLPIEINIDALIIQHIKYKESL